MTGKTSVHDLSLQKGCRTWLPVHVDAGAEAAAAVSAGIQILSCGPDRTLETIRAEKI